MRGRHVRRGGARSGRSRPAGGRRTGSDPRRPGPAAGLFPDPLGRPAQTVRRSARGPRLAERPALPRGRRGAGPDRPRRARPLRPRRERGAGPRRAARVRDRRGRVSPRARVARAARLLRRPRASGRPAAQDGRVRAFTLSAGVALSPRARRRVPGHQPGPVGAGLAARAVVGRGQRTGARRAAPAQRLRGGRSQAVDLPLPGRGRLGAPGSRHRRRGVAGGRREGGAAVDLAQLSCRAGTARLRQRPVRGGRQGAGPPRRLSLRRARSVPGRPGAGARARRRSRDRGRDRDRGGPRPGARGRHGPERRALRGAGGRRGRAPARGRAGPGPGHRPAPARRAARRRHSLPVTAEPPRIRAGAARARHPDLRLQGARLFRRRGDQGRAGPAALPGRSGDRAAGGGAAAVADRRRLGSHPGPAGRPPERRPAGWRGARPAGGSPG